MLVLILQLITISNFHLVPKIKNLDIPIDDKADNGDNQTDEEEEETKDIKIQVLKKIVENEKLALLALDGFLLVLNNEGDITYVSENIAEYLGLSKVYNYLLMIYKFFNPKHFMYLFILD